MASGTFGSPKECFLNKVEASKFCDIWTWNPLKRPLETTHILLELRLAYSECHICLDMHCKPLWWGSHLCRFCGKMQLGNHWIYYKILEVMLMRVSTWNRLLKARHSRDLNKKCEFCWCTKRNSNLNQIRRVRECNWNQWFGPDRNHLQDRQYMSNFRDNPRDNPVEIEIDNITDGKDIHGFDNDKSY